MARGFFFLSHESAAIVDPDFDEDWGWGSLLEHEVQATGVIPLHPDGDRRNGRDDPVPLHTRVYGDGDVAELVKREWAAHLENRKRWKEERQKREREWAASQTREEVPPPPPPSPPPPAKREYPIEEILATMQPEIMIHSGHGRVMLDHVMINEGDELKWLSHAARRRLTEVWRGQRLIIFKLR
jgi:hypothetical protein